MKRKSSFLWLVLVFFCVPLAGQTFQPVGNVSFHITPDGIWPADFDADGDLDALALHAVNTWDPGLYDNRRGENGQWLVRYPSPSLAGNPDFRAQWHDENGDGFLDFLATSYNDFGEFVTHLYLQSANHAFEDINVNIPGSPLCWADLDNDGRLDVITLLSTSPFKAQIYWGEPNRQFVKDEKIFFNTQSVQAADLDRDGDLDLLFQANGALACRNEGNRVFTELGPIAPSSATFGGISSGDTLIDLDGDGRLDMFGNRWTVGYAGETFICWAVGDFQMNSNRITFGTRPYAILDAADLDEDGIPELLLGGFFDPTAPAVILGRTNGIYAKLPYTFGGTSLFFGGHLADIDGDSDVDLLATLENLDNRVYLNQSGARSQPASPKNPSVRVTRDRVFFSWAPGSGKPATFNLRVGTNPGSNDLMDSASQPNGRRMVSKMGNTQTSTRWHLDRLKPGVYYWSVQSVDWGFRGSAFLPEMSFTVTGLEDPDPAPSISIATTNLVMFEDTLLQAPVVFGPESMAGQLTVTATSGDPSLVRVELVGSSSNRTLSVHPVTNRFGSTTIRIVATSDTGQMTEVAVVVNVLPVNDAPVIRAVSDTFVYVSDPPLIIPFAIHDVEAEAQGSAVAVSASSSDERILPSSAILVSPSSLSINLSNAKPGAVIITIKADDGENFATQSFNLSIFPRPFRWIQGPGSSLSEVQAADFDNDGQMELVTAGGIFANTPIGWSLRFVVPGQPLARFVAADFNGDNYIDVLSVSAAAARLHLNQRGTNFILGSIGDLHPCTAQQIETADFDNNGKTDVIITGTDAEGVLKTWVYLSTGDGFVQKEAGLPAFTGAFALGDLDRDGKTDFVFSGTRQDAVQTRGAFLGSGDGTFIVSTNISASVPGPFRDLLDIDNDGFVDAWSVSTNSRFISVDSSASGQFVRVASFPLGWPLAGEGGWADFENDGSLDFVGRYDALHGYVYLRNRGAYDFIAMGDPFRSSATGTAFSFADINNDGAIDIITSGGVWINMSLSPNFTPTTPSNLRATHDLNSVTFEWDSSFDINQRAGLTYNVRIGTRPGGNDVVSSASLPGGRRLLPRPGNAGSRTSFTITNLNAETYYWSVQAVDCVYAGSSFAPEQRFFTDRPGNLPPTITIEDSEIVVAEDTAGSFRARIQDDRTYPELVSVDVTSLVPDVVSQSDITITVDGENRIIQFRSKTNRYGTARLELRAKDAAGAVSIAVVEVTITPLNDSPALAPILPQTIDSPFDPITVRIAVSDFDDAPETLTFSAHSGDQTLIRDEDMLFGGQGSLRTIELKAASLQQMGAVPITVTITDAAGASATTVFSVTVTNRLFKLEPVDFGPFGPSAISWGDLNNDSWLDVAVSFYATILYTNGPAGLGRLSSSLPTAQAVDWGDYDRDGFLDLLLNGVPADGIPGSGVPFSPGFPGVYKNDGAESFALVTTNISRLFGMGQFADVNNDGALDTVLTGPLNLSTYRGDIYLNNGTNLTVSQRIASIDGRPPMLEDFDGDGFVDLHIYKLVNPTTSDWRDKILAQQNGVFVERVFPWNGDLLAWSDFNNDGKPDAIVLTTNGAVQLYWQSSNGFTAANAPILPNQPYTRFVGVGDFDADGLNDLLINSDFGVKLFRNAGNGGFQQVVTALPPWALTRWYPADYNNDGRLDLLITWQGFQNDRVTHLYRNTMGGMNAPPEAPSNLRARNTSQGLLIEWGESGDPNQSGGLTYNVAVGSEPGRWDILNPMSAPNGWRKIPQKGNAGWRRSKLIKGLKTGQRVYFTVQAVDNSFAGSTFASEQSIEIIGAPRLEIDVNADQTFDFSLAGDAGGVYMIEVSTDLKTWTPLWEWTAATSESRFTLPSNSQRIFIRATGR
jgi:hypothetical protein